MVGWRAFGNCRRDSPPVTPGRTDCREPVPCMRMLKNVLSLSALFMNALFNPTQPPARPSDPALHTQDICRFKRRHQVRRGRPVLRDSGSFRCRGAGRDSWPASSARDRSGVWITEKTLRWKVLAGRRVAASPQLRLAARRGSLYEPRCGATMILRKAPGRAPCSWACFLLALRAAIFRVARGHELTQLPSGSSCKNGKRV